MTTAHKFDVINSSGDRVGGIMVWATEEDLADVLAAKYPKLEVLSLPNSSNWALVSRSGTHLGLLRHVRMHE